MRQEPTVLATQAFLIALMCAGCAIEAAVTQTPVNVAVELSFTAARPHADPFNDVTLDAVFAEPGGRTLRVPAFWDGKDVWKVRYASAIAGTHAFRTECSDKADAGLNDVTGTVEVTPYRGNNPLYVHGPLRVSKNRRYLEHVDGTPFFWLGDTWWMGLCHRLHWPDEFKALTHDRVKKGFTVVQIVAGLYPDMPPFDPRGANEAGYPWDEQFHSIRPEYFDAADQRLAHLVDSGLTPCIVGAWGYFLPRMGVENAEKHWRYLVARYGAWPVVWCVAGEANLPYYLDKGFPFDDREQVKGWTRVARYLRETDPFHRPITIHPTGIGRLSARHAIDDVSLLDIDMLQTPHGQRDAVAPTVQTVRQSYADKPVLPVIDGEASYEMLFDSLPTEWTRRMFWLCMTNGAAGHTYGANGIWQCNRRGEPHGKSPHGGTYGTIPWDEAMNLPGSRQVGLGKKLFEQYRWWKFKPHPEWATYEASSELTLDRCNWIWFPEGKPASDAPAGKRYFRRAFTLPPDKRIISASLRVSADDRFEAWVNGKPVGKSDDTPESWRTARQFDLIAPLLKRGTNAIAIEAENLPAPGANPAGLIARIEVRFGKRQSIHIDTGSDWRTAQRAATGWNAGEFDDAAWPKAVIAARYGEGPWGGIDQVRDAGIFGPQSTGIQGSVRITYVPAPRAVVERGLDKQSRYLPAYFDPVSGERKALPAVEPKPDGTWTCLPPAQRHDWVLVLEEEHPSNP
jgi:hypothetical protein